MNARCWASVPLVMLAARPLTLAAQATPALLPAVVADSFFGAAAAERWRDAAAYLDLATFDSIRREAIENARRFARRPARRLTAEQMMAGDPEMPRVVAEYLAARAARRARSNPPNFLALEYANIGDPDSLAALSIIDAAAHWLQAGDMRYRMREAARRSGCPEDFPGGASEQPPEIVLGVVERDTLAYVLHQPAASPRGAFGPPADVEAAGPKVVLLRRVNGAWRVRPERDLVSAGGMFIGVACSTRKHPSD